MRWAIASGEKGDNPIIFCSMVEAILFMKREPLFQILRVCPFTPVAVVAFVFSQGTIFGAGATAGMWALIMILLATPVWVYLRDPREVTAADASVQTRED